jgi:hypothetical protein
MKWKINVNVGEKLRECFNSLNKNSFPQTIVTKMYFESRLETLERNWGEGHESTLRFLSWTTEWIHWDEKKWETIDLRLRPRFYSQRITQTCGYLLPNEFFTYKKIRNYIYERKICRKSRKTKSHSHTLQDKLINWQHRSLSRQCIQS